MIEDHQPTELPQAESENPTPAKLPEPIQEQLACSDQPDELKIEEQGETNPAVESTDQTNVDQ